MSTWFFFFFFKGVVIFFILQIEDPSKRWGRVLLLNHYWNFLDMQGIHFLLKKVLFDRRRSVLGLPSLDFSIICSKFVGVCKPSISFLKNKCHSGRGWLLLRWNLPSRCFMEVGFYAVIFYLFSYSVIKSPKGDVMHIIKN